MMVIGDVITRLEDVFYINRVTEKNCSVKLFIHFKNGEVTSTKISYGELVKLTEELKKEI